MNDQKTLCYVIVDDDEDDRWLTRLALAKVHRQLPILEFSGGESLLQYLNELEATHPAANVNWLILMDLHMQRLTGLETLVKLRAYPQLASTPIVIMTSTENPNIRQEVLDNGAINYFAKPESTNALTLLIEASFSPWL